MTISKEQVQDRLDNDTVMIMAFGRGRVVMFESKDAEECVIFNMESLEIKRGATVRWWGTNHGIAELTVAGVLESTKLDSIPFSIVVPRDAIHEILITPPDRNKAVKRQIDALNEAEKVMFAEHNK